MVENDGRLSHNGISLGQKVHYRYNRDRRYVGVVRRLTATKAVIHGQSEVHTVNYCQILESDKYDGQ